MFASVPEGYLTRAPVPRDAPQVAALIASCQWRDNGKAEMTPEELSADWKGLNLTEEAVVVTTASGQIAGYADIVNSRYVVVSVYGYVHPKHRGRGIGAYLVRWGEAWIQERRDRIPGEEPVIVRHYIPASNAEAKDLLQDLGYRPVRAVYWMARSLDAPLPTPQWPPGIRVRRFVPETDERLTFEAYEEASQDMWSRPHGSFERWQEFLRHTDPTLLFVAEEQTSGEIVGLCATSVTSGRGHVGGLRVRRHWRRQGVGLALLQHAFHEFYRRDAREASLTVDAESPTDAPRLYTRAGMRIDRTYVVFHKEMGV